jgi:Domain of unknown function (DUF4806)
MGSYLPVLNEEMLMRLEEDLMSNENLRQQMIAYLKSKTAKFSNHNEFTNAVQHFMSVEFFESRCRWAREDKNRSNCILFSKLQLSVLVLKGWWESLNPGQGYNQVMAKAFRIMVDRVKKRAKPDASSAKKQRRL